MGKDVKWSQNKPEKSIVSGTETKKKKNVGMGVINTKNTVGLKATVKSKSTSKSARVRRR